MNRRGFSLYELMVAMFLLGLLFMSAAKLASDFSNMHREDTQDARLSVPASEVLKYLVGRSRTALEVETAPGSLTLHLLDTSASRYPALPLGEDPVLPPGWQPDTPRLTETYQLSGVNLELDKGGNKSVLMSDLSGFETTLTDRRLELSLSWRLQRRVMSATRVVLLPLRSPP